VSEQNEIVSQVEIGGENKYLGYHTSNVSWQCGICRSGEHKVQNCENLKPSDVMATWRLVELHRLCFSCLRKHAAEKGEAKKPCGMSGCTKFYKNNIVMDTVNVIDENKSQVILRIVSVKIRGKTTIKTYALCDEASTTAPYWSSNCQM
jgi:hypothetical protein